MATSLILALIASATLIQCSQVFNLNINDLSPAFFGEKECDGTPQEKCNKFLYDELEQCFTYFEPNSEEGKNECLKITAELAQETCDQNSNSGACEWLKNIKSTSTSTNTTTTTAKMLPFIIGGVAGVIVLLAIGIGLYCYCRKKKKMGGQSKTQGLNTSGTTVNSGTGTGATATGTTPTNTQSRY